MTMPQLSLMLEPVNEEWRAVVGWEGLYEVSSEGRVRSLDALVPNSTTGFRLRKGRILRFKPRPDGYQAVSLSKESKVTDFLVHQLVARMFLPPPTRPEQTDVNHKDFDKTNCRATNLEWCTPLENIHHSGRAGRTGMTLNEGLVREIRRLLAAGHTQRAIAKMIGVGKSTVGHVSVGTYWSHVK